MERAKKKRFGMNGNGNPPAVRMDEAEMASSFVNHRKTQLAQGPDHVFRIYFFARHDIMRALPHAQW